jgi:hypothetical protein
VTQKKELLKNPTKIVEIEKTIIDRNRTITTCLLRDSNPNYQSLKITSSRSLFRGAANCTWLPLRISKVPVFCVTMYMWTETEITQIGKTRVKLNPSTSL